MTRVLLYDDRLPKNRPPPLTTFRPKIEAAPYVPPSVPPPPVDAVYATAVLSPTRLLSSFYWARTQHFGQPLILLDFEVEPLVKDSWDQLSDKLTVLTKERRARIGRPVGAFVESEILVERVRASGGRPHLIPGWLSSNDGWHALCQSAAGFLSRGDVGYTMNAKSRMDARPFLNAAGAYAGPRTDDPTVPSFLYGVVLGLDEAAARNPNPKPPKRASRGG